MYNFRGILATFLLLCLRIDTGLNEEICNTEGGIVSYCDGEKTYCCYEGTSCCSYWYTETRILAVGFICLCAGALLIPITCTICAYCIFNVILKKRTTIDKTGDVEAKQKTGPETELNLPIGCQSECVNEPVPEMKTIPEVFISPEDFVSELNSKKSDKICLIDR